MKLRDAVMGANASMYKRLNFRKIRGTFYPKNEDEVLEALEHARRNNFDVTPKGAGTGLSGACTGGNRDRIMVSTLQMKDIITISMGRGFADVQPGVTPNDLNAILDFVRLRFWVAPSSRDVATIGGLLSTDGGGNDSWVNGTMRDNTLRATLITYGGDRIVVSRDGVKSENEELASTLNKMGMNLDDVAASHGTLGFITEVRVAIRPQLEEKTKGAMVAFEDLDAMGAGLLQTIDRNCPIRYGESIVAAHPDVREDLKPPILILEFPEDYEMTFCNASVQQLNRRDLERLKNIRINLPKRQPKEGIQIALFEGYGFYDKSLEHLQQSIEEIDGLLMSHGFTPMAKYGHAPSKWYLGDNSPAFGLIMHSREIKPENKTGVEMYQTVSAIVEKCGQIGVTPKPEHKWPYSDEKKKARLLELQKALGRTFNSFIFEPECAGETLSTMV